VVAEADGAFAAFRQLRIREESLMQALTSGQSHEREMLHKYRARLDR
jgi:hypothetical protein